MEHRPFKNEMNVLCKIICGDRDFLADTERSTAMSILLPNCMGVDIIENAEHFFVYINHEAVSISIKSFLNSGHLEPSSHDI